MTLPNATPKSQLLDAAILHVPFDGWSDATFEAAIADTGIEPALAHGLCPRGAVDLALAYHARGDALMVERLLETDLAEMKFRDRIATAVRLRLELVDDKELVRRGMTLFSLPKYAPDGARAVWNTCDLIWKTLGDSSEDINFYSKRATLSAVYSATVLYWLGDDSEDHVASWEFLDRRIENVMQFEKIKAQARKNPLIRGFVDGPLSRIRAPRPVQGMPGRWTSDT